MLVRISPVLDHVVVEDVVGPPPPEMILPVADWTTSPTMLAVPAKFIVPLLVSPPVALSVPLPEMNAPALLVEVLREFEHSAVEPDLPGIGVIGAGELERTSGLCAKLAAGGVVKRPADLAVAGHQPLIGDAERDVNGDMIIDI